MLPATDYILNGQGYGSAGAAFNVTNRLTGRFDPGLLRPFIETDPNSPDRGRPCAEIQVGYVYNKDNGRTEPKRKKYRIDVLQAKGINSPVFNATTLTRDDWIEIDRAVERATRQRLTAWADLLAASRRGGFDAWSKMTLEYNAVTDSGEAIKDMDATSPGRDDTPLHLIRSVPLPVIHSDFSFPQRLLDQSKSSGMPLDTEMVEQGTRRSWELVEKTLIGTETGVTYGGRSTGPFPHTGTSTEWGYTSFPYRVTKTDLTAPLGTNPEAVMTDVLEMIETMNTNGYFGPFMLYHSTPYSRYINDDYFRTGSTSAVRTLRERLMEIDGISDIRRLDYLTSGYQLLLIDLGRGQFQAIDGMQPRTIQWNERGGMIQKFMTMMIQVPLLRAPYDGVAALIHGTTS
jgi:Family of unknown function (DUF6260)